MFVVGTGRALPDHYYAQDTIAQTLRASWAVRHQNVDRLLAIHQNTQILGRHLALPLEAYSNIPSFTEANAQYIEIAQTLATRAVESALRDAGLDAADIDHLFFVSITGIATPSIDARIAQRLSFRRDVKRTPIFGLGCMAGACGLARAMDYVRGHPNQHALLISVELCSLTLQRSDLSLTNIIASGLFGDGAGAAVISGKKSASAVQPARRPVELIASRSVLYPETLGMMGWEVSCEGFHIVLSGQIPNLLKTELSRDVEILLRPHDLEADALQFWICHPGGPKIFDAVQVSLNLTDAHLARSKASFHAVGNLSSASVLHILDDFRALDKTAQPPPGSFGCMLAFGPGLSTELVLLKW